ncbi:MAG: BamA/TamA family outer membrane protein [Bacteroidota bacterium]
MTFLRYIIIFLLFTACNSTKYLQEGEVLLEENVIVTDKDQKLSSTLEYELTTLPKQKENKRFFFIPREWIYFRTYYEQGEKVGAVKRWAQRRVAEEPTIYDSTLADQSALSMRNYLISKGFYQAEVDYTTELNRKGNKAKVVYQVRPDVQYTINKVKISSQDKDVEREVRSISNKSLLKTGDVVSLENYNNETARIVNHLRNNGYAAFNNSYIAPIQADSAQYKVDIQLEILLPADSSWHKTYQVGKVEVYTEYEPLDSIVLVDTLRPIYDPKADIVYLKQTEKDSIHFFHAKWKNAIDLYDLVREIKLKPGATYNLSLENQTNINLNSLGVFRFISIRSAIDSSDNSIINYKILLTRNQRIGISNTLNITYSDQNITQTRINLVGAAASASLQIRNALKGAELWTNSVSFGMEFEPGIPAVLNTIDIGLQSQLEFPRFADYAGLWKKIGGKKKDGALYRFLEDNATSRLQLSYNFLDRRRFYNYQLFNLGFSYRTQLRGKHQLELQHFGVNYFNPSVREGGDFETLLANNPFLQNSFGQQFFTGFLLRRISWFYTDRKSRTNTAYAVNANVEFSGAEVQAINFLYNEFALQETDFSFNDIDFSRYVLLDLDGRYYKYFNPSNTLAMRFNIGIGVPFGLSEEVPYVKQFYIGGPNSIRAFRAREVGPGAYCSPDIFSSICPAEGVTELGQNTPFYQTGNFKLELNAEYRFDLFRVSDYFQVEGALFAETGNVWLTEFDEDRLNAQFRLTPLRDENGNIINEAFYKQLALGTGFGLRMDINYVLIRLDMGYPLHTPYQPRQPWIQQFAVNDINYNLALNYPF